MEHRRSGKAKVMNIVIVGCGKVGISPVSYTHLTLPTNREV